MRGRESSREDAPEGCNGIVRFTKVQVLLSLASIVG
jgi:hypothetical protein